MEAERGYHPGESTSEGAERMAFDGTPSYYNRMVQGPGGIQI